MGKSATSTEEVTSTDARNEINHHGSSECNCANEIQHYIVVSACRLLVSSTWKKIIEKNVAMNLGGRKIIVMEEILRICMLSLLVSFAMPIVSRLLWRARIAVMTFHCESILLISPWIWAN